MINGNKGSPIKVVGTKKEKAKRHITKFKEHELIKTEVLKKMLG